MSIYRKAAPALIADPDTEFLAALTADPRAKNLPPVVAKTGKEAQLLLADSSKHFAGVFVNPEVPHPHGISVIRFSHLNRPSTPVFTIHNKANPFSKEEMRKLGILKALQKPLTYTDIMSLVAPTVAMFDTEAALSIAKLNTDVVDKEVSAEDAQFVAIRAENFLAGSKSFFDIYVRLGSGRYLKLIQAGDAFSAERVSSYIQKGVSHFYLRKEARETYVAYCDKIANAILKSDKVDIKIKAAQTLNQGEETLQFLKEQGVSEANLQHAANFVKNVQQLMQSLKPGQQPILRGFLNDVASYEHGVATSMIASLMINSMLMTSADPVETVGIASLLHDIGLYQLKLTEFDEDESKMNDDQKKLFYTHPTVGAEILKNVPRIKPVVLQAIAQHHERRNKKGFPARIGPGSISIVADIVGISDEFNRILVKRKKDPQMDLFAALEANIFQNFSNGMVNEFKKVFCFETKKY